MPEPVWLPLGRFKPDESSVTLVACAQLPCSWMAVHRLSYEFHWAFALLALVDSPVKKGGVENQAELCRMSVAPISRTAFKVGSSNMMSKQMKVAKRTPKSESNTGRWPSRPLLKPGSTYRSRGGVLTSETVGAAGAGASQGTGRGRDAGSGTRDSSGRSSGRSPGTSMPVSPTSGNTTTSAPCAAPANYTH
ncbi:Protein of unknown function [Gryllus bimaculatus]|nr:Protein of unknown function [Gryllus bimaculatus]